jgi:hypothetical protein
MKNLFVLFAVIFSTSIFGQSADSLEFYVPFIQSNDTIVLAGIQPNEVKVELADYASNVAVRTTVTIVNEKAFTDAQQVFLSKIAIAEAIETQNKIVSKLDAFRNKNVQLGGKTPIIERVVTVYAKQGTIIIYNN